MPSVAPAARSAFVVESISGLQRLQREMARVSQRDKDYESKRSALEATIKELRRMARRSQSRRSRQSLNWI
jgi:hypothetical protein